MAIGALSGNYTIYSKAYSSFLGLSSFDGAPGAPRAVIALPAVSPPPSRWQVLELPNGKANVTLDGQRVTRNKALIWAESTAYGSPTVEWQVYSLPQHGANAYMISTTGAVLEDSGTWVVPSKPNTQVKLSPYLTSTPSIPPFFQPDAILYLDRLD
ncbi:hypothetical protein DFP72DRAFT_1079688 [Ephemerocybe angulata]|uniref:Uncharacterized protein n=1 Tax=Ephemerocybe angulata TaxID=980116 RepID=A0A8H6LTX2_9AGAR|nr:hypothetical protein DFP72DRAFT_1079688 [Tulosesus angulatus]